MSNRSIEYENDESSSEREERGNETQKSTKRDSQKVRLIQSRLLFWNDYSNIYIIGCYVTLNF